MIELNYKIQILFFFSLLVLSVHALEISILNVSSDFKCKTKIKYNSTVNGERLYADTFLKSIDYQALLPEISMVIIYVVKQDRYEEIANFKAFPIQNEIALELSKNKVELIVLGVENSRDDDYVLVKGFIRDKIKNSDRNQKTFDILIIGETAEQCLYWKEDIIHPKPKRNYEKDLQKYFTENCPKTEYKSKRSDPQQMKQVKLYEYLQKPRFTYLKEVKWPVSVQNGEYVPDGNISLKKMANNFVDRYKNATYHILIVSGTEYNRIISSKRLFPEFQKTTIDMREDNNIFLLMGCFNFDWSEIDLARQIIMKHSLMDPFETEYKVFFVGIGMFTTYFENQNNYDTRHLLPTENKQVIQFVKKLDGRIWHEKFLEIYDFNASNVTKMHLSVINGRYIPFEEFKNYSFSTKYQHPNVKFAFVVVDPTEIRCENVFSVPGVDDYVEMFKNNGIIVFLIKAFNFEVHDLHFIPEWIEWHRKNVHPDRIMCFGGGPFETIYQYISPSYQIFYTTSIVPENLKGFRRIFVNTVENRAVYVVNIDSAMELRTFKYPMYTVNGFYDPVVISKHEMFLTRNATKILFVITGINKFNSATTGTYFQIDLITELRQKINKMYPANEWTVYLVGLENFGINDLHLFAEFVKMHTDDKRPFQEFVHTFGDGIYQTGYVYKDMPFTIVNHSMARRFNKFFGEIDVISNLI